MRDRDWSNWDKDGSGSWRGGPIGGGGGGGGAKRDGWRTGGCAGKDWCSSDGGWSSKPQAAAAAAAWGGGSGRGDETTGSKGGRRKWGGGKPWGASEAANWDGPDVAENGNGQANMEDGTAVSTPSVCGDAKLRLVRLRRRLDGRQAEALESALKRKREEWTAAALPLGQDILSDVRTVLEQDSWNGTASGAEWLREWLSDGVDWARVLEELQADIGQGEDEYYCHLCWQACASEGAMEKHKVTKDHRKRQRTWEWRYGVLPEATGRLAVAGDDDPAGAPDRTVDQRLAEDISALTAGASKGAAELLKRAIRMRSSPVAAAKRRLLEYRDSLTAEQRKEILTRIGLPRANDVGSLRDLQAHFQTPIVEQLGAVKDTKGREDMDWICREPTFSWLSGFYWHPESTSLEQQGQPHSAHFCHLCEADAWTEDAYKTHCVTRRHAENSLRWAEMMGNMEHPSHCRRCPDVAGSASSGSGSSYSGRRRCEDTEFDLEYRRDPALPDIEVVPETRPPTGFREYYQGDRGRVLAVSYVAVAVQVDQRVHAVRILSKTAIGPKEKAEKHHGRRQDRRSYIDLFWCAHTKRWKSLAMAMKDAATGELVHFTVAVQWSGEETAPWEELDEQLNVQVPRPGEAAVICADLRPSGAPVWVECKPVMEFIGRGQIDGAGGLSELRGSQRPMQFATEDVMISFLLWVPEADEPKPLLLFFHGDMPRGVAQCPQPGLADFAPTYGPALLVVDEKRRSHPSRDFVVVTPCCSEEVWWLRHPAVHDSTAYAENVEKCLRGIMNFVFDLGLSPRERGTCFAGQSMGAYMALEMARAMPEGTAGVLAGAPCFDACRLDHLAARLVNVPVWLLIGRNDTMCSFEEVASLALKMRDLDAKLVRLTSAGIKGHSEVGKKLEKHEPFEWLKNPLG